MKKLTQSLSIYRLLIFSWALCTFTKPIQCVGQKFSGIGKNLVNKAFKKLKEKTGELKDLGRDFKETYIKKPEKEGDEEVTKSKENLKNHATKVGNNTPQVVESPKDESSVKDDKNPLTKFIAEKFNKLKPNLTGKSSRGSLFSVNVKVDKSLDPLLNHVKETASTVKGIKKDVKATLNESKAALEQIKATYKQAADSTLGKIQTAATTVTVLCGVLIVYFSIQTARMIKSRKKVEEY